MTRILKRIILTFLTLLVFFSVAGWLVLTTPLARDLRVSITQDFLSDILDRPVVVDEDAYLALLPEPAVVIRQLRLPADNFETLDLAVLEEARFALPVAYLIGNSLVLPDIKARGLSVNLLRDETGKKTWIKTETDDTPDTPTGQPDLIDFLGQREVSFKDMEVRVLNEMTGFEFQFELTEFDITQLDEGSVSSTDVRFRGLVNRQPATFDGVFPENGVFDATAQLGELLVSLKGQKPSGQPTGSFAGTVEMQTDDLQNLLDTLRLKGSAAGAGTAAASVSRINRRFNFEDIDLNVELANGKIATLSGDLADPRFKPDIDLVFLLDLVGNNPPLSPAVFLKDIRPSSVELRVIAKDGVIEVDRLSIETNAFAEDIRDIGPFRIKRVSRAEDGRLQLKELTLTIGPEDAPFVVAEGNVDDLLEFRDYSLSGKLDLPAQAVLLTLDPEQADDFGRLTGSMEINDEGGKPSLDRLVLSIEDTMLWDADLTMTGDDLTDMKRVGLQARLETPSGKEFLRALQLDPVEAGHIGFDLEAGLAQETVSTKTVVTVEDTVIENSMMLRIQNGAPVLRGQIDSRSVKIRDLQNALKATEELSKVRSLYSEQKQTENDYQPLVLPTNDVPQQTQDDLSEYQPLVIDETPDNEGQATSEYQPLVISETAADIAIADLLDWNSFVRLIDATIGVTIDKIEGRDGITRINSEIALSGGLAQAGPFDLSFGRGSTALFLETDLVKAPDWLRIHGTTGGWSFGKALNTAGVEIGADGILDGSFDLRGRHDSAEAFARSMTGRATIDMRDGRIDTALLDLAGLGVLPWLFSQDRRQGYAQIVCLKAPILVNRGTVSTSDTVLETRRVQLVGSGTIDLVKETINFKADPRPVGEPLSRSAWPFEVTGALTSPDIRVAKRTRRIAREPVSMPDQRVPCVPDVQQLRPD